jgi:hypothetical protein
MAFLEDGLSIKRLQFSRNANMQIHVRNASMTGRDFYIWSYHLYHGEWIYSIIFKRIGNHFDAAQWPSDSMLRDRYIGEKQYRNPESSSRRSRQNGWKNISKKLWDTE